MPSGHGPHNTHGGGNSSAAEGGGGCLSRTPPSPRPHGGNVAFCSRRPRKITPPPLPVPLKLIKFSALTTPPINRHLGAQSKQAKTREKPRFCPHFFGFAGVEGGGGFRKTLTHRTPEVTKFPMPAVRHESKGNPAMRARAPAATSPRPIKTAALSQRLELRKPHFVVLCCPS